MPTVDNIDIQITASLKKTNSQLDALIKKLRKVSGVLSGIGVSTEKANKSISLFASSTKKSASSINSLAAVWGRFYANFFPVIRGIKQLNKSINETADYIEAFNYYTVAFGKIASKWDKNWQNYGDENARNYSNSFVKSMNATFEKLSGVSHDPASGLISEKGIKNLGLNIKEVTQYSAQLASMMDSVGQNGEIILSTADAFTRLAGDISSLYNIDYSSAANNMRSVLMGQSRAGYKFGWDTTNAGLQNLADQMGIGKAVSEMTQMEKQQLRIIAILQQSRVAWGDQANTINNYANQVRLLKNKLKEAGIVLGQLFIPMLSKIIPVVNGAIIAVTRLMTSFATLFGIKYDSNDISSGFNATEDDAENLADSMEDILDATKKAKSGLRGFDELKTINTGSGTDASLENTIDLTQEIIKATQEYEKVWQEAYDNMEQKAQQFADRIEVVLRPLKKLFKDISVGDWFAVGADVSDIAKGILDTFTRAIEQVDWNQIGENIGNFLKGIDWKGILSSLGELIWEGINGAIELWKGSFNVAPIETTIATGLLGAPLLKNVGNLVGSFKKLSGVFGLLTPQIAIISGVIGLLATGLGVAFANNEDVRKGFGESIKSFGDGLKGFGELLTGTILPDIGKGLSTLFGMFKPFEDFFVGIWQDLINPLLKDFGDRILPELTDTLSKLWTDVLVPVASLLGDILAPVLDGISWTLSLLWDNIVYPILEAIGDILYEVFHAITNVVDLLKKGQIGKILQWLGDNVVPVLADEFRDWGKVIENVFGILKEVIGIAGDVISGFIRMVGGLLTGDWKDVWGGAVNIFGSLLSGMIGIAENIVNAIISLLNLFIKKLSGGFIDTINDLLGKDFKVPQIPKVTIPRPKIPKYEVGGYPTRGDLFFANENGVPELVGTMGGKTAVASGMEITGIKDAIYETGQRESGLMSTMVGLLRVIADKDYGITDDQIGKSAQRYAKDYFNRTGNDAYSF
jgi:hypothetical protein